MANLIVFITTIFILIDATLASSPCRLRNYGQNNVCVCNKLYCDTIDPIRKPENDEYHMYVSTKSGERFNKTILKFKRNTDSNNIFIFENNNILNVNYKEQYQTILGFGGAFTDATGINIKKLSEVTQNNILRSYFSTDGLEYSIGRVPMGGTDFSTFGYSYLDYPNSAYVTEKNYTLVNEDYKYKIPLMKVATSLSSNLIFFTSTWAAPKSWKTDGTYHGPGELKTQFYQNWADYFIRFLDLYKQEGFDFWGITTGNEAYTGFFPTEIPTVAWLPWNMKKWITENLGPTIRNSENHKNITIIGLDDQRLMILLVQQTMSDPTTAQYIDGIGVHWYWDSFSPLFLLDDFHRKFPTKFILATEACSGAPPSQNHVILGSWERGQDYANSIMENLQHWSTGWVDWNMALDLTGGPTYINNNVDSPIIVNTTSDEFYKQPMFYAMGHFSKFLPRDSVRFGLQESYRGVKMVAFQRPDNIIVIILVNSSNVRVSIKFSIPDKGIIDILVQDNSFTSICI